MKGSHLAKTTAGRHISSNLDGQLHRPGSRGTLRGGQKEMMGLGRDKFAPSSPRGGVHIETTLPK